MVRGPPTSAEATGPTTGWNDLEDYLSERDLIHLLVETVALGGNLHLDDLALCRRHDPDAPAGTAGADGRLAQGQRRGHLRHEAHGWSPTRGQWSSP